MEVIINGTKYIIDITEDELFKFFEVNSVDVKLAEEEIMKGNKTYVVVQDFNDEYGGGSWEKLYYQTKDDAIKVLEQALDEGQACYNDFVLELESFENINDTIDVTYYLDAKKIDDTVIAYFVDNEEEEREHDYKLIVK